MTLKEIYFIAQEKKSFNEFEMAIKQKLFNVSEIVFIEAEIEIDFNIKGYEKIIINKINKKND